MSRRLCHLSYRTKCVLRGDLLPPQDYGRKKPTTGVVAVGADSGTRTRNHLLGRQVLHQLSYVGIFSFHNIPGVARDHRKLHTGLEHLLRRHHSAIHLLIRPSLERSKATPGVSRNFSALRQCIWSHPYQTVFCRVQPISQYVWYTQVSCTIALSKPLPYLSFQGSGSVLSEQVGLEPTTSVLSALFLLSYCSVSFLRLNENRFGIRKPGRLSPLRFSIYLLL